MTKVFDGQTADGDSTAHTIASNISTVNVQLVGGDLPAGFQIGLKVEHTPGAGTYEVVHDWVMTRPGAKNIIANGTAGLKCQLFVVGLPDDDSVEIDAWIN